MSKFETINKFYGNKLFDSLYMDICKMVILRLIIVTFIQF